MTTPINHRCRRAAPRAIVAALALAGPLMVGGAGGGCASKLETGYEPRRLGASDDVRRGFYAQPFTPEARAAKQYEQDFGDPSAGAVRRPRPD